MQMIRVPVWILEVSRRGRLDGGWPTEG